MRTLGALYVLHYSPLNLLVQTTIPKVTHPIDIKVRAPEAEQTDIAKLLNNKDLLILAMGEPTETVQ
jgi:hypothetical protein